MYSDPERSFPDYPAHILPIMVSITLSLRYIFIADKPIRVVDLVRMHITHIM